MVDFNVNSYIFRLQQRKNPRLDLNEKKKAMTNRSIRRRAQRPARPIRAHPRHVQRLQRQSTRKRTTVMQMRRTQLWCQSLVLIWDWNHKKFWAPPIHLVSWCSWCSGRKTTEPSWSVPRKQTLNAPSLWFHSTKSVWPGTLRTKNNVCAWRYFFLKVSCFSDNYNKHIHIDTLSNQDDPLHRLHSLISMNLISYSSFTVRIKKKTHNSFPLLRYASSFGCTVANLRWWKFCSFVLCWISLIIIKINLRNFVVICFYMLVWVLIIAFILKVTRRRKTQKKNLLFIFYCSFSQNLVYKGFGGH